MIRSGRSPWPRPLLAVAAWTVFGIAAMGAEGPSGRVGLEGIVVDEASKPVAGVTVSSTRSGPAGPAKTNADGRFGLDLAANPAGRIYTTLIAAAEDGRLGVLAVNQDRAEPVTIAIKPARSIEVHVVDRDGKPASGAEVAFLSRLMPLYQARADADGVWSSRVPADAADWSVVAFRPGLGFDYAQGTRARGSTEPPLPLPDRLTLTLDGARSPLRVKAVDLAGRPLAGIKVAPWLITRPGRAAEANLAGMESTWTMTGADGGATLDWLPEKTTAGLSILTRSDDFYAADHATLLAAGKPVDDLTVVQIPLERLEGRVIDWSNRPVEGVKVVARGQGGGNNAFRGSATTDPEGRYSLRVYSEQAYILTAGRGDLAAPYRWGVVVRAGKPVAGIDLILGRATRVRGRVTLGSDGKPVGSTYVQAMIDRGGIPDELKRPGDRFYHAMTSNEAVETDADGRYEIVLGPGEYRIQGPSRTEPIKLAIPKSDPPAEVVADFRMPRPEDGPFRGTVVDAEGKPVAGATVSGTYTAPASRGRFYPTKTDAKGTFSVTRALDPLVLHAETPDRALAALARVDAEAAEARIALAPTATARGRLVDPSGAPLPGQKLNYGIRIYLGPTKRDPFSRNFGGVATTGADGRFTAPGLLVGEKYDLFVHDADYERMSSANTEAAPNAPGPLDLGDVTIDFAPLKPNVPTTAAERAAEAFDARKTNSPREKLDDTLVEAARESTRPLLLFGAPKDPACVELFRLFNEPSEDEPASGRPRTPADLRWEFELATLDAASADVLAFARDLKVPLGDGDKTPALAVLAADGRLAESLPLRPGPDGKLDASAIAGFLGRHKLPTRDAEALLADGLAKAKAEHKRTFLILSASWCGPCRLLARFLAANKAELDRHFVFVKLDISRDDHAGPLRERYKGSSKGGVPWYAILDEAGNPLVTSNAKALEEEGGNTNIGFPSSKVGIDHFLAMLRQTAPGLTDDALATLRARLGGKP